MISIPGDFMKLVNIMPILCKGIVKEKVPTIYNILNSFFHIFVYHIILYMFSHSFNVFSIDLDYRKPKNGYNM